MHTFKKTASNSAKYKHIYLNYRAQKFPLKMLLLKIIMIGGEGEGGSDVCKYIYSSWHYL